MALNQQNLKPLNTLSKAEAKEIRSKGGKARQKQVKERKSMKEQMEILLSSPFNDVETKEKFKEKGFNTEDMNNQMALIIAMYQKAMNGDTSAMNIVREITGERVQQISIDTSVDEKVKELSSILDDIE